MANNNKGLPQFPCPYLWEMGSKTPADTWDHSQYWTHFSIYTLLSQSLVSKLYSKGLLIIMKYNDCNNFL